MKRRRYGGLLAVLLMAACSGERPAPEPGGGTGQAPAGAAAGGRSVDAGSGPVKIGVVLELSGPTATFGEECMNGLNLALASINEGRERPIELVVLDNKSEAIETANSVKQLIEVNRVLAIIGAVASTNTMAGSKVAQESGVPMMSPASTNEKVTDIGENVSRICFIDPFQGLVLAKFARDELKATKAVVITDKASDYSLGLAQSFRKTFTEMGGQIAGEESFTAGDADFSALISTVRSYAPDVIFIPGYYNDVGPMLRQAKGSWDNIPKLGGDGWDSPSLLDLGGAAVFGNFISTHFAADDPSPKVQDFVRTYTERFGRTPGAMGALGFDSALVIADALDRVQGPLTRASLREAINSTKGVEGIAGTITLDEKRNAVKDAVIVEVTPQGFQFKSRVAP
jgi:branched-chain amino acid transport system substrate-binding protein